MRLSRTFIALVVFLVCSRAEAGPPAANAAPSRSDGRFEIALFASIDRGPRREALKTLCRADYDVVGCTDFPRETLDCGCKSRGGAWVIDGRVELEAVIRLSPVMPGNAVLVHEQLHLGDVERGLRERLDSIGAMRFGTRTACDTYAKVLRESPFLRIVMNELRAASNAKYGCDRAQALVAAGRNR